MKIENDISSLATLHKKEVNEIERLLEVAAENAITGFGTLGGLDKIVERDDEGGGEQAEDEENDDKDVVKISNASLSEEIDRIY